MNQRFKEPKGLDEELPNIPTPMLSVAEKGWIKKDEGSFETRVKFNPLEDKPTPREDTNKGQLLAIKQLLIIITSKGFTNKTSIPTIHSPEVLVQKKYITAPMTPHPLNTSPVSLEELMLDTNSKTLTITQENTYFFKPSEVLYIDDTLSYGVLKGFVRLTGTKLLPLDKLYTLGRELSNYKAIFDKLAGQVFTSQVNNDAFSVADLIQIAQGIILDVYEGIVFKQKSLMLSTSHIDRFNGRYKLIVNIDTGFTTQDFKIPNNTNYSVRDNGNVMLNLVLFVTEGHIFVTNLRAIRIDLQPLRLEWFPYDDLLDEISTSKFRFTVLARKPESSFLYDHRLTPEPSYDSNFKPRIILTQCDISRVENRNYLTKIAKQL